MGLIYMETISAPVQLADAKRARKNEQEKDKRKQRQELERIKEAEAQKAHEAALAAIEGRSASELIKAVKPSQADSSRFVQAPHLALSFLHKQSPCSSGLRPRLSMRMRPPWPPSRPDLTPRSSRLSSPQQQPPIGLRTQEHALQCLSHDCIQRLHERCPCCWVG